VDAPRLGTPVRHLATVGSTMTAAAEWAAAGAPHGALVVADHQQAGRGRHGRAWIDAPGASLLLSLVLRLAVPPERLPLVGLAAALAVVETAHSLGADAAIKWPNDVTVGGRKLAGVLAEAVWTARSPAVILGVGVNVQRASVPPELATKAISLDEATGATHDRLALLPPFLAAFASELTHLAAAPDRLTARVEARLAGLDAPVHVAFPGTDRRALDGIALGLAPGGALRVLTETGEQTVHAGEVTLRAAPLPL
jgi:BirA family biotin operon repressor/biotin-[acetyl-CoA-carboxylase] ligase